MVLAAAGPGTQASAEQVVHWTMPTIAIPESARPSWPNVFGTVALPVRARPTGTRWTKLLHAALDQPALIRLAGLAQGMSAQEQVAYVQSAINRATRLRTDGQDCSDDGYWAAGSETLARGLGDCFDLAVAKMEALRSLGFADRDLYLTTGYIRSSAKSDGRRGTAALLVHVGDSFLLLPDGPEPVINATGMAGAADDFSPYITYGYGMTWVHGRVVKQASAAAGEAVPAVAALDR